MDTSTEPKTITVDGIEEVTEWTDHGGRSFYIHTFKATTQPPVATVTLVHGLGEHIDRYEEMGRKFAHAGIQAIGFDQRGFGKTGRRCGRLGDNEGIDTVADDIAFISSRIATDDVPHFLFGHSMGGLNVLNYAARKNQNTHVRGVIASAPALRPGKPLLPPRIVEFALHQVVRVAPSLQKNTGISVDMLTSNQSEIDKFNASVENIGHCTLGTLSDIIKRGADLIQSAPSFDTPVLLVHADGDQATDCDGTRSFYSRLPNSLDKEFNEVKGVKYHELHFEQNLGFDLLDSYVKWILDRAK
ncbi:hypothetical protein IW140_002264 [Coemansia sp. RSA 1813]|nr:hypothetical protein EV178_001774 [Coemansia sp. RSA 1646]KAJ1770912.1 hypothetical protein LPJ74_002808 [Coemansia sp. RSA 1843]KAJ2092913.1 hypothetical protein IW138_000626 [Coemansia sp. RSA 986]KAJ2216234.1 hypothetical protein EV179_001472 [Coemansia sp. RSA 487]KAJ2570592.1 hypothetical protein IW140_002264 [Coemansia sp. RSA 1813]